MRSRVSQMEHSSFQFLANIHIAQYTHTVGLHVYSQLKQI